MTRQRLKRRNYGTGHGYTIDGTYAPGVTTVLGQGLAVKFDIPSRWAARLVAEYAAQHRDWLVQAPSDREIVDVLKAVPNNTRDDAALKGTTIHDYAQTLHDTGAVDLAPGHELYQPHVEALAAWLDEWDVETVATEVPLCHTEARWAGTSDLIARSTPITQLINSWLEEDGHDPLPDDALGILDLKTGNGIRDKDKVQVVAYSRANLCHIAGDEQAMPPISWAGLVHCQADQAELHLIRPAYTDRLWRLWTAAFFEWQALDEKRGWISYAVDTPDSPILVIEEGAA